MVAISFYFKVHQPFRISDFRVQYIGSHKNYFNDISNKEIFEKIAKNCYLPAGLLIASLLKKHSDKFKVTFSITGTFLEQCCLYSPKVLELYQDIMSMPNTEILCETSHHSLAALFDEDEFFKQIDIQKKLIKKFFNRDVTAFRNTELIYSNKIGKMVSKAGFHTCLVEGWEPYLPNGWNSHHVFHHPEIKNLKLFPKSYKLSDDIAFRFSNKMWPSWPLTAEKYYSWIENLLDGNHECIGLFMDYETFGRYHWRETGIFEFLDDFVSKIAADDRFEFLTVSDVTNKFSAQAAMDVNRPLSWVDSERDISPWFGNRIQINAIEKVYKLKNTIELLNDMQLTEEWRKLLTSDHFYYMCINSSNCCDEHQYFSPFDSPYEAYLNFVNIIEDFEMKCNEKLQLKAIFLNKSVHDENIFSGERQEYQKITQLSRHQKIPWRIVERPSFKRMF